MLKYRIYNGVWDLTWNQVYKRESIDKIKMQDYLWNWDLFQVKNEIHRQLEDLVNCVPN